MHTVDNVRTALGRSWGAPGVSWGRLGASWGALEAKKEPKINLTIIEREAREATGSRAQHAA